MERPSGRLDLFGEEIQATKTAWIVLGIVEMIAGVVALAMPGVAALATTVVLAVLLGVAGIARLVHGMQVRRGAGLAGDMLLGVLYLVAAVLILARPVVGAIGLGMIVGAWCIAAGAVGVGISMSRPRLPAWGWMLAAGLASIVLGVLILAGWPAAGVWAIGLLVGINLVLTGLSAVMVGMSSPQVGMHDPPTAPA